MLAGGPLTRHPCSCTPRVAAAAPAAAAAAVPRRTLCCVHTAKAGAGTNSSGSSGTAAAAPTSRADVVQQGLVLPWQPPPAAAAVQQQHVATCDAELQLAASHRHPIHVLQQQHGAVALQPPAVRAWPAQHAAAMQQWQLLTAIQQDETSAAILACSSVQQLLDLASKLASRPRSTSKWHFARLAAMAAVLTCSEQQPAQQQVQQAQHQLQQQQLAAVVLQGATVPCITTDVPMLRSLKGPCLSEALHALHQLLCQHFSAAQQRSMQQQLLQPQLATLDGQTLLRAVHGCNSVPQLASVLALTQESFSAIHVKAACVQLARLQSADSSGQQTSAARPVLQQLLVMLPHHAAGLQPHQCAGTLWSLGQLVELLPSSWASKDGSSIDSSSSQLAQLLDALAAKALNGIGSLNPRVSAQLLHGAARLQLHLPAAGVQGLLQHTEQQLQHSAPRELACMLWSLAKLQQPVSKDWLHAFYSSSWRWLQDADSSSSSSSSSAEGHQPGPLQQQQLEIDLEQPQEQQQQQQRSFLPGELAALLTAAVQLQLQPPSAWLHGVAHACCLQLRHFGQRELGLALWGFARLQYLPPLGLMAGAAARAQALGPQGFQPQSQMLFAYGMTRLCHWHVQQQRAAPAAAAAAASQPGDDTGGSCQHLADSSSSSLLERCVGASQQLLGVLRDTQTLHLQGFSAIDLAMLSWLAAVNQQQLAQQGARAPGGAWQHSLLAAALVQLQRRAFTPQGLAMLVWGLGSAAARQEAGCLDHAAFWGAVEASAEQHAAAFNSHELVSLLWGAGAVAHARSGVPAKAGTQRAAQSHLTSSGGGSSSSHAAADQQQQHQQQLPRPMFAGRSRAKSASAQGAAGSPLSPEVVELLACQLLDSSADALSPRQAAAALQALLWLGSPRARDLLQASLGPMLGVQGARPAGALPPTELLLLLRACIACRPTLDAAARRAVAAAVGRLHRQLTPSQLAQVLYAVGKLQMQHNQHSRRAAAAAHAGAAAGASSSRQSAASGLQLQLPRVELQPLLPPKLLQELLLSMAAQLQYCSGKELSLMLWGVSHLLHPPVPHTAAAQAQHSQHHQQQQDLEAGGSAVAEATAALLAAAYPHSQAQLPALGPGQLATLLYALQRLRAAPPPAWLAAAEEQLGQQQLEALDGQSLAVLALAVSGLHWSPSRSLVAAYVQAVAAADRRGVLQTHWQRRCIANGLAALDPLAAARCAEQLLLQCA